MTDWVLIQKGTRWLNLNWVSSVERVVRQQRGPLGVGVGVDGEGAAPSAPPPIITGEIITAYGRVLPIDEEDLRAVEESLEMLRVKPPRSA